MPHPDLLPGCSRNFSGRLAYYFEPVGSLTFLVQQTEISDQRITVRVRADPDRLAVLALDDGTCCHAWVANLSPQTLDIALALPRTTRQPTLRLAPYTWMRAAS